MHPASCRRFQFSELVGQPPTFGLTLDHKTPITTTAAIVRKPNNPDAEDDPSWQITTYRYDARGSPIQEISPAEVNTVYTYDTLGRLTEKTADSKSSGIQQKTQYGYDRLGILS